ncbi:MAG: hypothetical protein DRJ42_15885 [Deltaproteobacteria bacterium]|nr:MAG: hypothetical protein DRJ42_15885 [Deltaproteobacteria bacterium]
MTSYPRALSLASMLIVTLFALGACGDDGGGTTDSGTATDSGAGDSGADDAATDGSTDGGADGSTDGGDDGGGGGASCITHLDPACGATEYCDFDDNLCGTVSTEGVCRPRPEGCDAVSEPSCGCNGLTYSNGCSVMAAGFDLNNNGTCTPAASTFNCGSRICQEGMEYCSRSIDDTGRADTYSCLPLPAGCMTAGSDCTCFDGTSTPCADMCAVDAGNFTLTCPGG